MIITVCGEKGGTGKTTIATNLAAMRAAAGKDVLLIDTDPQGSSNAWSLSRDENEVTPRIACIQKFGQGLRNEITDLAGRYQDIIIDAGGRDSVEMRLALVKANVAVFPFQASSFDVWTLQKMNELILNAQGMNESLRVLAVITRAINHATNSDAASAAEALADYPALPLSKSLIKDRIAFRRASGQGMGVVEMGTDAKAAAEMLELYKEVFNEA